MVKHSKQRDSKLEFLRGRYDHPTAETIYENVREKFPKISLGTVYRNLALLTELGEIQTLTVENGPDRFDGNAAPHYHFICKNCNAVIDLDMPDMSHIDILAGVGFDGVIESHVAYFYGKCGECVRKLNSNK